MTATATASTTARKKPAAKAAAKTTKSPQQAAAGTKLIDATALLEADHREVSKLFKQYARLVKDEAAAADKQAVAADICAKLRVHTTVEEELFYPAARAALSEKDDALVDEADVEHAGAKDLIAQIEASSPADDHYDAKVKVLGEQIDHHVGEEEEKMFPKVRKTSLDLDALGARMQARKQALTG